MILPLNLVTAKSQLVSRPKKLKVALSKDKGRRQVQHRRQVSERPKSDQQLELGMWFAQLVLGLFNIRKPITHLLNPLDKYSLRTSRCGQTIAPSLFVLLQPACPASCQRCSKQRAYIASILASQKAILHSNSMMICTSK